MPSDNGTTEEWDVNICTWRDSPSTREFFIFPWRKTVIIYNLVELVLVHWSTCYSWTAFLGQDTALFLYLRIVASCFCTAYCTYCEVIWVLFLLILDFLSLLMAPLQEKQHVRDAQWHSHTSQHYQPLLQPSVSCWKWVLLKFHGTYYPSPKVTLLHLLSLQMSACNIVQKVTITKGSSALDWYRAWKQVMEFQFNLIWSNSKDILAGLQQDSSNYKDNCLHQI